jgi:pyrimidine-nucleoside phosphorylase
VSKPDSHQPAHAHPPRAVDVIRKKRDGHELSREEIESLIRGVTDNSIPDYQVSAWLMAALIRGLSMAETAALTEAMLHSGEVLDFSALGVRTVDKHSTGGVGDKTSLALAPIVAAGGLAVPMISGRGLGHTGGTLDKLEAIPGFNVKMPVARFREVLAKIGCAMIGQTAEIAPADRKLYALRDVTGTVESPYLICASIMSKKLAEGIDGLVLDVKTGSGAFMKSEADAVFLAELMVDTGERMGKRVVALITDMDQPLGFKIGNALEVEEIVELLEGGGPQDLRDLTVELAGWMFYVGDRTATVEEGKQLAEELIGSRKALEKFYAMVEIQGGDVATVRDVKRLPKAAHTIDVLAHADGFVTAIACEQVGTACVILGGGRERQEDAVDPAVGLVLHRKVGDRVKKGERLATIHYNSDTRGQRAKKLVEDSYQIGESAPAKRPLVHRVIQKDKSLHKGEKT